MKLINLRLIIISISLSFVLLIISSANALATEEYVFERMQPVLEHPWYFYLPQGVTIDDQGNVYVADTENNRIQKFSSSGAFITKWGSEGAPGAWIEIEPQYAEALGGLEVGDEIMVMTWMHLTDRSILKVHPRGNRKNPVKGVFATHSPHRPNPIGLHKTRVIDSEPPSRIKVEFLEVINNTPVVDIKPVVFNPK